MIAFVSETCAAISPAARSEAIFSDVFPAANLGLVSLDQPLDDGAADKTYDRLPDHQRGPSFVIRSIGNSSSAIHLNG